MKIKNVLVKIGAAVFILIAGSFTAWMLLLTFEGIAGIIATGAVGEPVAFDSAKEVRIDSYSVRFLPKSFAAKLDDGEFVLVPILLSKAKGGAGRFCYSRRGTRIYSGQESAGVARLYKDMWEALNGSKFDYYEYSVYHKSGRQCVTVSGSEPWFMFFEAGEKFNLAERISMKFRSENLGDYYYVELGVPKDCRARDLQKCVFE